MQWLIRTVLHCTYSCMYAQPSMGVARQDRSPKIKTVVFNQLFISSVYSSAVVDTVIWLYANFLWLEVPRASATSLCFSLLQYLCNRVGISGSFMPLSRSEITEYSTRVVVSNLRQFTNWAFNWSTNATIFFFFFLNLHALYFHALPVFNGFLSVQALLPWNPVKLVYCLASLSCLFMFVSQINDWLINYSVELFLSSTWLTAEIAINYSMVHGSSLKFVVQQWSEISHNKCQKML